MSLESTILGLSPIAYWPLTDSAGSSSVQDLGSGGYTLTAVGASPTLGEPPIIVGGGTCCYFDSSLGFWQSAKTCAAALVPGSAFFFYKATAPPTGYTYGAASNYFSGAQNYVMLMSNNSTPAQLSISWGGNNEYASKSGLETFVNQTAIFAASVPGTSVLYSQAIGGSLASYASGTSASVISKSVFTVGGAQNGQPAFTGYFSHVAWFNYALTQADIESVVAAASSAPLVIPGRGFNRGFGRGFSRGL